MTQTQPQPKPQPHSHVLPSTPAHMHHTSPRSHSQRPDPPHVSAQPVVEPAPTTPSPPPPPPPPPISEPPIPASKPVPTHQSHLPVTILATTPKRTSSPPKRPKPISNPPLGKRQKITTLASNQPSHAHSTQAFLPGSNSMPLQKPHGNTPLRPVSHPRPAAAAMHPFPPSARPPALDHRQPGMEDDDDEGLDDQHKETDDETNDTDADADAAIATAAGRRPLDGLGKSELATDGKAASSTSWNTQSRDADVSDSLKVKDKQNKHERTSHKSSHEPDFSSVNKAQKIQALKASEPLRRPKTVPPKDLEIPRKADNSFSRSEKQGKSFQISREKAQTLTQHSGNPDSKSSYKKSPAPHVSTSVVSTAKSNSSKQTLPSTSNQKTSLKALERPQIEKGSSVRDENLSEGTRARNASSANRNDNDSPKPDANQVQNSKIGSPPLRSTPQSKAVVAGAAVTSGASLPMLRSSPVAVEPADRKATSPTSPTASSEGDVKAWDSKEKTGLKDDEHQDKAKESCDQAASSEPKRKRKKVSWAAKESLVDVHFIDTRIELVKSWDAESQITLPFAPATLHMFQQAISEQDAAKKGDAANGGKRAEAISLRSMPKMTSFEEARKREHDMEQGRAQRAREDLKDRLNAMAPTASWKKPIAIVLPAECRIDEGTTERVNLIGDENVSEARLDSDASSPPSPSKEWTASYQSSGFRGANVPIIPLSDRLAEGVENEGNVAAENSSVEEGNYLPAGAPQDYYGERRIHNAVDDRSRGKFRNQSDHGGEYNYGETRNDPHDSSNRDLRSGVRDRLGGHHNHMGKDFADASRQAPPGQAHAVQHLLSALQSSGLLKQGNGFLMPKNHGPQFDRASNDQDELMRRERGYREVAPDDGRGMRNRDDTGGYAGEGRRNGTPNDDGAMQMGNMAVPDGSMGGPMMGGQQMGGAFRPGVAPPGMMDMVAFAGGIPPPPPHLGMAPPGMPPPPPPPMGLPPPPMDMLRMMQMGLPLMPPMPPGAMPMNEGNEGHGGPSAGHAIGSGGGRGGAGRGVETISRPKPKSGKQRKRCKYFGTKQGCRDGNACMYAHH